MSNVKVMVGQTWCDSIGQVLITKFDGRIVEFKSMPVEVVGEMGLDTFYRKLSFVPATELEWLALKSGGISGAWKFAFRDGNRNCFTMDADLAGKYNYYDKSEIISMRVHLGLETEPTMTTGGVDMRSKHDKPVYTQEMVNAVAPPLVSSSVIVALSYDELGERLGEFSGKEVDIIASTPLNDKTILTVSHYTLGVAAMCMNSGLFMPIDNRTTEQKQLDHVTHLVGSMSHLPAIETGQAIIDYINGK